MPREVPEDGGRARSAAEQEDSTEHDGSNEVLPSTSRHGGPLSQVSVDSVTGCPQANTDGQSNTQHSAGVTRKGLSSGRIGLGRASYLPPRPSADWGTVCWRS